MYARVSPGAHLLTKKLEDSAYEIAVDTNIVCFVVSLLAGSHTRRLNYFFVWGGGCFVCFARVFVFVCVMDILQFLICSGDLLKFCPLKDESIPPYC